jgi:hypothetical protein
VYAISDWYALVGEYSFPTIFLFLAEADRQALLANDPRSATGRRLLQRLASAMAALPGASFVGADTCAPDDSPKYRSGGAVTTPRKAWELLATSPKVRTALESGASHRLTVRPHRRMDRTREFRMFIRGGKLVGMSQYCLERHFARLAQREAEFWRHATEFVPQLLPALPMADLAMDVYLTSRQELMVVDLNPWGPPTDPLLFRSWERDWEAAPGIRLIPPPQKLTGDVSISF